MRDINVIKEWKYMQSIEIHLHDMAVASFIFHVFFFPPTEIVSHHHFQKRKKKFSMGLLWLKSESNVLDKVFPLFF